MPNVACYDVAVACLQPPLIFANAEQLEALRLVSIYERAVAYAEVLYCDSEMELGRRVQWFRSASVEQLDHFIFQCEQQGIEVEL